MKQLCWIVRAVRNGVSAIDTNGATVVMPTGMKGWMEQSEALAAALRGDIEILSPDGVKEYQTATETKVKPNGVQTKDPTVLEAPAPAVAPEPEVEAPTPPLPQQPKPTPSAAPAPPRVGPQLKAPVKA